MLSRTKAFAKKRIKKGTRLYEISQLLYIYLKHIYQKHFTKAYRNPALLKYKNIHKGKRCFIVATGPSLTLEDLNMLKANNEITFGVNSCIRAFDKTSWRPTYYCVTDPNAVKLLKEDYKKNKLGTVFYQAYIGGSSFYADNLVALVLHKLIHVYRQTAYYKRTKKEISLFRQRTSLNAAKIIYDGSTVVFTVIQLALYMGFKEIYLLGTDCNYASLGNCHSKIASYSSDDPRPAKGADARIISGYRDIKEFLDRRGGCNIYNASRGGNLEVFARVNFDDLFTASSPYPSTSGSL